MDPIENARSMFGNPNPKPIRKTVITEGTAVGDSDGGFVVVDMGGNTVSEDGQQSVRLATVTTVRKGDKVQISLTGESGSAKRPMVIGVIGGGDRTKTEIDEKVAIAISEADGVEERLNEALEHDRESFAQAVSDAIAHADSAVADAKSNLEIAIDAESKARTEALSVINGTVKANQDAAKKAAGVAKTTADAAQAAAEAAQATADATNQSFYTDDSGAHVKGGDGKSESLWNSLGMLIKNGLDRIIASFTGGSVTFFDGEGEADSNIVANYSGTGVQVGKLSGPHMGMSASGYLLANGDKNLTQHTADSVAFYDGNGNSDANIVARYGDTVQVGKAANENMVMNSTGIVLRKGSNPISQHTANSVSFYDSTGAITANYSSKSAQIGKLSGKHISVNGTDGFLMADGSKPISQISAESVAFFDGNGDDSSNITATYSSNGARIGKLTAKNLVMNGDGIHLSDGSSKLSSFTGNGITFFDGTADSNVVSQFSSSYISIGKNSVNSQIRMCGDRVTLSYSSQQGGFTIESKYTDSVGIRSMSGDNIEGAAQVHVICAGVEASESMVIADADHISLSANKFTLNGERLPIIKSGWKKINLGNDPHCLWTASEFKQLFGMDLTNETMISISNGNSDYQPNLILFPSVNLAYSTPGVYVEAFNTRGDPIGNDVKINYLVVIDH